MMHLSFKTSTESTQQQLLAHSQKMKSGGRWDILQRAVIVLRVCFVQEWLILWWLFYVSVSGNGKSHETEMESLALSSSEKMILGISGLNYFLYYCLFKNNFSMESRVGLLKSIPHISLCLAENIILFLFLDFSSLFLPTFI